MRRNNRCRRGRCAGHRLDRHCWRLGGNGKTGDGRRCRAGNHDRRRPDFGFTRWRRGWPRFWRFHFGSFRLVLNQPDRDRGEHWREIRTNHRTQYHRQNKGMCADDNRESCRALRCRSFGRIDGFKKHHMWSYRWPFSLAHCVRRGDSTTPEMPWERCWRSKK